MSEQEPFVRVREAVTDLVTNAFRLGMAHASGADVFFAGEIYSYDQLAELQVEKSKALEAAIAEAERDTKEQS
jgi:hypothetical protein